MRLGYPPGFELQRFAILNTPIPMPKKYVGESRWAPRTSRLPWASQDWKRDRWLASGPPTTAYETIVP